MTNHDKIIETDLAVNLLRENLEMIRINLEILDILRQNGRIKGTDNQYVEILDLDLKNRRSFQDFALGELPGLLKAGTVQESLVLKKLFLDWAADLHLRLNYQNRIIKDYIHQIAAREKSQTAVIKELEIKDKRFWNFLHAVDGGTNPFESFEVPENPDPLNQADDPEENKAEQQGKEE